MSGFFSFAPFKKTIRIASGALQIDLQMKFALRPEGYVPKKSGFSSLLTQLRTVDGRKQLFI